MKIDALDKKILSIIGNDARMPFKDVATVCGVSRAAVHQRVQKMMDADIISGSGYLVNPKILGFTTCTYVGIKLENGSMYKRVSQQLNDIPEVVECHFMTGPFNILVKLYAHDNEHLMRLLNDHIQLIEGVTSTDTMISLEQSIHKQLPTAHIMDELGGRS